MTKIKILIYFIITLLIIFILTFLVLIFSKILVINSTKVNQVTSQKVLISKNSFAIKSLTSSNLGSIQKSSNSLSANSVSKSQFTIKESNESLPSQTLSNINLERIEENVESILSDKFYYLNDLESGELVKLPNWVQYSFVLKDKDSNTRTFVQESKITGLSYLYELDLSTKKLTYLELPMGDYSISKIKIIDDNAIIVKGWKGQLKVDYKNFSFNINDLVLISKASLAKSED